MRLFVLPILLVILILLFVCDLVFVVCKNVVLFPVNIVKDFGKYWKKITELDL